VAIIIAQASEQYEKVINTKLAYKLTSNININKNYIIDNTRFLKYLMS
jgi:hypothetical protein